MGRKEKPPRWVIRRGGDSKNDEIPTGFSPISG
jgi:hypothetical protein